MSEAHTLKDFLSLLRSFSKQGFEYVVIGGCAVGAYASMRNETVVSRDLDIYVSPSVLQEILAWAPQGGLVVRKRPQPRALPVAVFDWNNLEINALTRVVGMPEPSTATLTAREFKFGEGTGLVVPLADPFNLLSNKLAVKREKDKPHIEVLKRFVREEVVAAFELEEGRHRLIPARRFLEVLQLDSLPMGVAERLVQRAREPVDFRFLASRIPQGELVDELLVRVSSDPELKSDLERIIKSRIG